MPTPQIARPLIATDLGMSYAGRTVLDGVDLRAGTGQRVGENGAGKSTLLRLLAGIEQPDSGTVDRPPSWPTSPRSRRSQRAPRSRKNVTEADHGREFYQLHPFKRIVIMSAGR